MKAHQHDWEFDAEARAFIRVKRWRFFGPPCFVCAHCGHRERAASW